MKKEHFIFWIHYSSHFRYAVTSTVLLLGIIVPTTLKLIRSNQEFDEICLRYRLKKTDPIAKKLCTSPDSCALLGCAKLLRDRIDEREHIGKVFFNRTRNSIEISFAWRAPGLRNGWHVCVVKRSMDSISSERISVRCRYRLQNSQEVGIE